MKFSVHNKSNIILSALTAAVFIGLLACTIGGEDGLFKLLRLRTTAQQLARTNHEILKANVELFLEIQDLKNADAIERVARESLGLIYSNEVVFVKPSSR